MKSALGGILTGSLLLIVGQVVLTASQSSTSGLSNILSIAQVPAQLAANWMSPDVPLIPDLSKSSSSAPSSSTAPTPAPTPAPVPPVMPLPVQQGHAR